MAVAFCRGCPFHLSLSERWSDATKISCQIKRRPKRVKLPKRQMGRAHQPRHEFLSFLVALNLNPDSVSFLYSLCHFLAFLLLSLPLKETGIFLPASSPSLFPDRAVACCAKEKRNEALLGPKLLLAMGCVKLSEKNCVHLPSVGEQTAN